MESTFEGDDVPVESVQPEETDFAPFASSDGLAAPTSRAKTAGASVLAAAMLAVGEILEPEKTEVTIEQLAEADMDDPLAGLHFGELPPIS